MEYHQFYHIKYIEHYGLPRREYDVMRRLRSNTLKGHVLCKGSKNESKFI